MWRKVGNGLFIVSGSTGDHAIALRRTGTEIIKGCSCMGYCFRRKCKHVEGIEGVQMIDFDEIDKVAVKKFGSSLKALNFLVGDEFYSNAFVSAVYGEPKVGKTLLLVQDAFYLASQGANVLFLDTEGSLEMIRKWKGVFEARFGKKGKLFYDKALTMESLLKKVGLQCEVIRKEKKSEFRVVNVGKSEIKGVDYVLIDSISAPFRELTSNQQDFPVRADAMGNLMLGLMRLMEEEGCGVMMSVHASFNPANPFDTKAKMRGGSVVEYFTKRVIYVDKREAKELSDYRRIWLVRGEDEREWSRAVAVKISELGFEDITSEEMAKCFTENEKKRVAYAWVDE